jgi:adhesin/invasin
MRHHGETVTGVGMSTRIVRTLRLLAAALLAIAALPLALATPAHALILPPATVTVTLTAPTITVGDPSFKTVNATVKDAAGNNVDEGATVAVTAPDSDVILSSSNMTRRADGTYRASYRASKTAGTSIIKVTASSSTSTQPVSGTATLTEVPGPTATLTVVLNPSHVPADGATTSTATITAKDQYDNPVPTETVAIATGDGDDSQPGPVTNNNNGTYTSIITASSTPDVETIFASGGGKTGVAELTEYGEATSLTLAIDPASIAANGTSTATATATITDAGGRGVANQDVTITKPLGADSTLGPVSNNGDGTYSATITSSTTTGTDTYSAAATGTELADTADLSETHGAAALVSLTVDPNTLVANGTSQTTASATVTDASGNGVPDETVTITTNKNAVIGAVSHVGNGVYTATITAPTIAGSETITAKAVNANKTGTATLNLTHGAADGVSVVLTPSSVVANGTSQSTAKATVTDVNGNKVVNETVVFSKDEGSDVLIGGTTNNGDGTYSAIVTSSTDAGLETIHATTSNSKTGNAVLTQTPGPAAGIVLSLDPATIVADGAAQSTATATVTDANGNAVLNENVTITKPATGSDIAVGPVTNNGDGTYSATITASSTQGTNLITAKAVNANKTTTATLTETHGPVTSVVLVVSPTLMEAKVGNTSTATVTVKDAKGNLVSDEALTITKPDGTDISVSPVTNNNDGTYTATIAASTTPGTYAITATAPSSGATDAENLVLFGPVQTVTVVASPSTVPADGTSTGTATATLVDAGGRPVNNQTVQFSFDAPGNMTILQPVTNHGNGTYSVTFKASNTPGTEVLRATASKTGTTTIIEYGAASTVALALSPATIAADGTSTSTATATVKDANANPVLNEIMSFATNGDVSVGSAITNHGNGTYSVTLTASTSAGAEKITATATRANKFGEATLTETAGAAATVVVVLDPTSITADGVDATTATVTVTDANGNPVTGETVTLSSDGDTAPADSGATTNNGDGTYTGTVVSSTTAGQDIVTATAAGTGAFGTAAVTEVAGEAANITVSLSPSIIEADGTSTSTATATVTDAFGNLVSGEDVEMVSDGDTVVGDTTDNGNGTYSATVTASTTAGDESISASIADTAITNSATLTESAGPVSEVDVTLAPTSIVANGTSQTVATATVNDANGNPVTNDKISFLKDGVEVVAEATNNGDGTYSANITSSTVAGPKTITASSFKSGQTGSDTLTEIAGPLASFSLSLSPASIVANGAAGATATASLADAHGNAIKDKVVAFSTNGDTVVGSTTNHDNGTYSAPITSSTTAGTETITASIASLGASKTATLTETAGAPAAITLSLNPSTVVANGSDTSTATATVLDTNGNPVKDAVVTIATAGDSSVGPVANKGDGTYSAPITSSITAGNEVVTAAVTGTGLSDGATLTETAGPASTITPTLSSASIVANGTSTSTATATVADANGNAVKNETVTFAHDGDVTIGATTNLNNGNYRSTITSSTTAGVQNITATAVNANKTSAAKVLTETAGAVTTVVVALQPSTIQANGADTSVVTATVTDANGNPVTNQTVTMSTNGNVSIGGVTNNGNGTYTATLTASNTPGTEIITARATQANKTGTATLTETARPTGYWLTGGDAGVFNYGAAGYFGSTGGKVLNKPVVTMVSNPADRAGYWQVASDGGVFAYGSAGFFGSKGGQPLNAPVVGMAPTADGKGYWLVGSDGGIFNYGNAGFFQSMGGKPLNKPIVGIVRTASGQGYWMVASDGGVFAFGDAGFMGSKGGAPYARPIVGFVPTPNNDGYWMVADDGAIFPFGSASTSPGTLAGKGVTNIVGMASTASGNGYYLAGADGQVYAFGDAVKVGSPKDSGLPLVQPISGIDGF